MTIDFTQHADDAIETEPVWCHDGFTFAADPLSALLERNLFMNKQEEGALIGRIGDVGGWDIKLTEEQIALLASDASPLNISPEHLIFFERFIDG